MDSVLAALLLQVSPPDLDLYFDDARMRGATVSAFVADASGNELYSRGGGLRMIPGSNQKLLTAAFALATLGPGFRPSTQVWKLKDRIVVDAPGDPTMTRQRLLDIKTALALAGDKPVYVRNAFGPLWPPSWEWDDFPNRYAAKVSAFTVDRGGFELWAEDGRAFFVPDSYGVSIFRDTGDFAVRYDVIRERALVAGPLPSERTRLDTLALPHPDRAASSILGSALRRMSSVPSEAPTLISSGPPLFDILIEALPASDNNVFESLLLMSAGIQGDADPYSTARQKVTDFAIQTVGVPASHIEPYDGSGMSRHNVMTSAAIVKLLTWARAQPWSAAWVAALAKPGAGTLRSRLEGMAFSGKTGSLHMVAALSGYLRLDDGRELSVSVIANHYACTQAEARDFLDGFMKKLLDSGNRGTLFAIPLGHESARPDPRLATADGNRLPRLGRNSSHAQPRDDQRDEPSHAHLHRAERVAVRLR